MATNLEISIMVVAFVSLVILMALFFKSKDTKTNREEIKNYYELISKLKTENNPKQRLVLIMILFSPLFFFAFLSTTFDQRKKLAYIFIVVSIIVFIAALSLLLIGLHN
jgi:flagellar basal body-associated protein FliL